MIVAPHDLGYNVNQSYHRGGMHVSGVHVCEDENNLHGTWWRLDKWVEVVWLWAMLGAVVEHVERICGFIEFSST